jgi:transcriptional regulator with XRE-family HTH domain
MKAVDQQYKICSRCGIEKPTTTEFFSPSQKGKENLRSECKACAAFYHKEHRYLNRDDLLQRRNKEIFNLYHRTNCDSLMKQQMLAKFYDIKVSELKQIIKTEDEKSAMEHKTWTAEMNAELLQLAENGATLKELADKFGASTGNISWRVNSLRKKADKPTEKKKAATINEDFEALFPKVATKTNKPDYTDSLIETLRERLEDSAAVNSRLVKTVITLDNESRYADSLIETLREHIETVESDFAEVDNEIIDLRFKLRESEFDALVQKKFKQKPAFFDTYHASFSRLEQLAVDLDITPTKFNADAGDGEIYIHLEDDAGSEIYIGKKNPPTGTAIPVSGE